MGKKKMMKLPFLSQSKSLDSNLLSSSSSSSFSSPSWPFPSCGNIRTLSFRAKDDNNNNGDDDDAFRTFNSVFLETEFTPSESSRTFSTLSEDSGDPVESVIRGLRSSERFFFEPERSSLLLRSPQEKTEEEEEDEEVVVAYNESEVLSMDSNSPYEDFRRSMEEMVEAHGLKDWKGLEELLGCYLKINGDTNHGYIVGAFIDLLVSFSFASFQSTPSTSTTATNNTTATAITTTTTTSSSYSNYSSPSSPLSLPSSSLTTPCVSSMLDHGDDDDDGDGHGHGHGHGHDDDHQHV